MNAQRKQKKERKKKMKKKNKPMKNAQRLCRIYELVKEWDELIKLWGD